MPKEKLEHHTLNKAKVTDVYQLDKIPEVLGQGMFGTVCIATNKDTGSEVAVKMIAKRAVDVQALHKEVDIHCQLKHENIVQYFEVFMDYKKYYIVLEKCDGGELIDRVTEDNLFGEVEAQIYFRQIMSAIGYMHENNFVHRDIKPENFLFESREVGAAIKVIDFGLASSYEVGGSALMTTKLGTPYYVAPQVLQESYNEKCDVWSCGVVLYLIMAGYPPFNGGSEEEIYAAIQDGDFEFPEEEWGLYEDGDDGIKCMITSMLKMDPEQRISAQGCLTHPWLKEAVAPSLNFQQSMVSEEASTLPASMSRPSMRTLGTYPEMPIMKSRSSIKPDVKARLTIFKKQRNLKMVALDMMAIHLSNADIEALQSQFERLDIIGVGKLKMEDIKKGVRDYLKKIVRALQVNDTSALGLEKIREAIRSKDLLINTTRMLKDLDGLEENSDLIDYRQFLAAMLTKKTNAEEDVVWAIFSMFASSESGQIEKKEVPAFIEKFKASGFQVPDSLGMDSDKDEDGNLSFEEFQAMWNTMAITGDTTKPGGAKRLSAFVPMA